MVKGNFFFVPSDRKNISTKAISISVVINVLWVFIHVKFIILINFSVNWIYCTRPSSYGFYDQMVEFSTLVIASDYITQVIILDPPTNQSSWVKASGIMRSMLWHLHYHGLYGRTRGPVWYNKRLLWKINHPKCGSGAATYQAYACVLREYIRKHRRWLLLPVHLGS